MIKELFQAAPRYARVAGLGFKSGRMSQEAEGLVAASRAMANSKILYQRMQAANFGNAGETLVEGARRTAKLADRYASHQGLDPKLVGNVGSFAHDAGKFINPVLTPAEHIVGGVGRVAGNVLSNPIGQTALFMSPMFLPGGGESPEPQSYQEMGAIAPSMTPPDSYQQMYSQSYGMPANPQLDEEQIRRARKRAEEQAALNQFYAQALNQYQGQ